MEICNKCGKGISIKIAFEIPLHIFQDEFYCLKCLEKAEKEFFKD